MASSAQDRDRERSIGLAITLLVTALALLLPASALANSPAFSQNRSYRHGAVPRKGYQHATAALSNSANNLAYGGAVDGVGVTTGAPRVYLVFWGSQWGSQSTNAQGNVTLSGDKSHMAPYLEAFIKGIGTGGETWSGVMTQYCQGVATGTQFCPSSNSQHVG
jgi:hypothetical protein